MSPVWLDDWIAASGTEVKEYYKGVKMLRTLSEGAVMMCREVWSAAGKVWAKAAREQREEERVQERRRRVDRARRAASTKSLEKRRKEAGRVRCWLQQAQKLAR